MEVDEATVRRIAQLARIEVTAEEASSLQGELTNILQWVEQLEEVDTNGVEPMTCVVPTRLIQREDVVNDGDMADAVTANAPLRHDNFYVVPNVVE